MNGNNNNIINGNNNSINFATPDIPSYDSDGRVEGLNDTLASFLDVNDSKEVKLSLFIEDPTFFGNSKRQYYNTHDVAFTYQKEQFDIIELKSEDNKITTLEFLIHAMSDELYNDEVDGSKKNYYFANDVIDCKVNINAINQNLLFENKDYVTIKGKYFISTNVGGQGNNFATLEPRM